MIRSNAASTRAAATARSSESRSDSSSSTASQSKSESSTSRSRSSTSTVPFSVSASSASSASGKNSSHAKSESSVSSSESSKRSVLMLWCSPSWEDHFGVGAVAQIGRNGACGTPVRAASDRRARHVVRQGARGGLIGHRAGIWVHADLSDGNPGELSLLPKRRRWDLNPRLVAQHTISSRADSAALALLRDCSQVRLTAATGP